MRPSLVPAERLAPAKPGVRAPHSLSKKRSAIIHYWLVGMRGGEKVVEALCRLLPDADIFTLFYEPEEVSSVIRARKVHASFLNPLRKHYRSLLPLMPLALEAFDLRDYDLVISSESGPAKGVIVPSSARHICYCHTPMRYLWDLYPAYLHEFTSSGFKRALMAPIGRLPAVVGFRFLGASGFVHRQQPQRATTYLANLPARIAGDLSPGCN